MTDGEKDYRYDVFISYRHAPNPKSGLVRWITVFLYEQLMERLFWELDRRIEIFLDDKEIRSGDDWKARLGWGLAHSRCLIAVYSVPYFSSEYCIAECKVILHREEQYGYGTNERPSGLVLPICIQEKVEKSAVVPQWGRAKQYKPMWQYFFEPDEAFLKSNEAFELKKLIKEWIENEVVPAIEDAPPWEDNMASKEWIDHIFDEVIESRKNQPAPPKSPPTLA